MGLIENQEDCPMMTKKQFAALCSAKETMQQINDLLAGVKVTNAYNTNKAIGVITEKWLKDFADTDPRWMPDNAAARATAVETA